LVNEKVGFSVRINEERAVRTQNIVESSAKSVYGGKNVENPGSEHPPLNDLFPGEAKEDKRLRQKKMDAKVRELEKKYSKELEELRKRSKTNSHD
tara:strand:- start:5927 stop:6211 length:285 start_codon:yes stop_codon:yes gene_type:complete